MPSKKTQDPWENKDCSEVENVRWVAKMMGYHAHEIKPEMAPSPSAWALYLWAASSPMATSKFFTNYYPKVIPTQTQAAKTSRADDIKDHEDRKRSIDNDDRSGSDFLRLIGGE